MRVLITGATGFLGARVADALVDADHRVWGLARSERSASALEARGIRPARGDLTLPPTIDAAVAKAAPDAVVHLAAEIATQRSKRRIRRVNVEGTRTLAHACRRIPLKRFLFFGSVVVGQPGGALLTEDAPLVPTTAYGHSKVEGETLLREASSAQGFRLVILRPSHVYGPGGWMAEIVGELRKRTFVIPGNGENIWDVVHVDDVVQAAVLALEAPEAHIEEGVFHVVDDEPVKLNDFIAEICHHLDRRLPWHVPTALARLVAGRGPVDAAVRSARSSNDRLRQRLGWEPRYPDYRGGVEATMRDIGATTAD